MRRWNAACVAWQRIGEEGAVERHLDDLLAQLLQRAQRHEGGRHLLQVGDVLLQVLQRLADLQRHQAAQTRRGACAAATSGSSKTSISTWLAVVDQRRKADQRLAASAHFHQLGQFAEGPRGVARRCGRCAPAPCAAAGEQCGDVAGSLCRHRACGRRPVRAPAPASTRPAPGTQCAPARPSSAFSDARWRPMPSWRPCSSTTRKFMNRCGASVLELEVVALHGELGALAHELQQRVEQARLARTAACSQNSAAACRATAPGASAAAGAGSSAAPCTLSRSMPGTSQSQRSSLTWFSA